MSPLQVILAFAALHAGLVAPVPGVAESPLASAAGTLALFGGLWLAFHAWSLVCRRRLDRGQSSGWRGADAAMRATQWASLAALFAAVALLGWLDGVRAAVGDLPAVDELIALLPWAAVQGLCAWSMHPIERRVREAMLLRMIDEGRPIRAFPSRGRYVSRSLRHAVGFAALPLLLLLAWSEATEAVFNMLVAPGIGGVRMSTAVAGPAMLAAQGAGVLGIFLAMPEVLRRVWETRPLPPGRLRDDLLDVCREAGVRVRDVLLWRTDGLIANGAVMGLIPRVRYVVLTDALLDALRRDEVRAVMAHEAGHVRRRHMVWLGLAVVATALAAAAPLGLLLERAGSLLPGGAAGEAATGVASLLVLGPALLVVGAVSRRFELQADAFAVQTLSRAADRAADAQPGLVHASSAEVMASALGRVALLNGLPRQRFTWRHGTIAGRQRAIRSEVGRPLAGMAADLGARRAKLLIVCLLAGGVAAQAALLLR